MNRLILGALAGPALTLTARGQMEMTTAPADLSGARERPSSTPPPRAGQVFP